MILLLFLHSFNDAVREGDGDRVLRYRKFFGYNLSERLKEITVSLSHKYFLLEPCKAE